MIEMQTWQGMSFGLALLGLLGGWLYWSIKQQAAATAREDRIIAGKDEEILRSRLAEDEARMVRLIDASLAKFEIRLLAQINGTYLRGHEAQSRFEALEKGMDRIESFLTGENAGLRKLVRSEMAATCRSTDCKTCGFQ
jgi:hypothetical protein